MSKILLAESDVCIREVLKSLFEESGHEVAVACHMEEALAHLANYRPDFMVTEVVLAINEEAYRSYIELELHKDKLWEPAWVLPEGRKRDRALAEIRSLDTVIFMNLDVSGGLILIKRYLKKLDQPTLEISTIFLGDSRDKELMTLSRKICPHSLWYSALFDKKGKEGLIKAIAKLGKSKHS